MRTRFAPSPTGSLHVGGLRTALYAWLLAKKSKGKFLLRIEDTDQERSVPGTIESILRCLGWAGIPPDEGVTLENGVIVQKGLHGPYIQSERKELYQKHAKLLLAKGHAYRCFCSKEQLEEMRKTQEERHQAPMYDRRCLSLAPEEAERRAAVGEPHVLRMKIPDGPAITVDDIIRGTLRFERPTVDDQILLKSDGFPTYHLAHVVDDHLMQIDLVLRGEEWLSSLPKHIFLFQFFGWPPPEYAHVSLLLNKDRTKLSKRQNAVSVEEYIANGYLPQTLLNFLALLGWNPGTTQEVFSLQELIEEFSLDRAQKAGAIFDTEKLDWLQGQWIRRLSLKEFLDYVRPALEQHLPEALVDLNLSEKLPLIQERITFAHEAPAMLAYFYREVPVSFSLLISKKQQVTKDNIFRILNTLLSALKSIPLEEWKEDQLKNVLGSRLLYEGAVSKKTQHEIEINLSDVLPKRAVLWVLRSALTGLPYSPGAFEIAAMLGKEKTLDRLLRAQELVSPSQ